MDRPVDATDDKYLATADRVFELAKKARSLWNQRTPSEQRDLLELVVSNPTLDGVSGAVVNEKTLRHLE